MTDLLEGDNIVGIYNIVIFYFFYNKNFDADCTFLYIIRIGIQKARLEMTAKMKRILKALQRQRVTFHKTTLLTMAFGCNCTNDNTM